MLLLLYFAQARNITKEVELQLFFFPIDTHKMGKHHNHDFKLKKPLKCAHGGHFKIKVEHF